MTAARDPKPRRSTVFLGKPHPAFRLCPYCRKRRYASRHCARRDNAHIRNRFRVYWCSACLGFHITKERRVPTRD